MPIATRAAVAIQAALLVGMAAVAVAAGSTSDTQVSPVVQPCRVCAVNPDNNPWVPTVRSPWPAGPMATYTDGV